MKDVGRKVGLGRFLAHNPFPHGLTDGLFYREKMRAIHRVAPVRPAEGGSRPRILEIGGGRSGLAALLYPGAQVVTVDLDVTVLGQGPGAAASDFVCADACRLPFGDGQFDAVTLFDVLEHVPDDARASQEALRVTRPGGWVLLSTPNASWRYPWYGFMRRWCPPEASLMQEWGHVRRGYEPATLERIFGRAPQAVASFINPLTAFYHDLAFSNLGRRRRKLLYTLTALPTLAGYLFHGSRSRGTECAYAWRRPLA